jgi:hypothetical protein
VKNNAHWRAFETVFEVYFSLRGPEYKIADGDTDLDEMWREMQEQMRQGEGKGTQGGSMDAHARGDRPDACQALMNGDQAMMRALAKQAVQRFAGMEPGRPVGGTYYLYRTLRNLDLDGHAREADGSQPRAGGPASSPRSRSASSATSTTTASSSSRRRSRRRSVAASSPTAASRRWPRRCASRCPKTSTSCTRRATRCRT